MKIYMTSKKDSPLDKNNTQLKFYIMDFYLSKYISNHYVDLNKDVLKKSLPFKLNRFLFDKESTVDTRTMYTTFDSTFRTFNAYSTSLSKYLYKLYFINRFTYILKQNALEFPARILHGWRKRPAVLKKRQRFKKGSKPKKVFKTKKVLKTVGKALNGFLFQGIKMGHRIRGRNEKHRRSLCKPFKYGSIVSLIKQKLVKFIPNKPVSRSIVSIKQALIRGEKMRRRQKSIFAGLGKNRRYRRNRLHRRKFT